MIPTATTQPVSEKGGWVRTRNGRDVFSIFSSYYDDSKYRMYHCRERLPSQIRNRRVCADAPDLAARLALLPSSELPGQALSHTC